MASANYNFIVADDSDTDEELETKKPRSKASGHEADRVSEDIYGG